MRGNATVCTLDKLVRVLSVRLPVRPPSHNNINLPYPTVAYRVPQLAKYSPRYNGYLA